MSREKVYIVPLLHPAAVARGRWADEPQQVAYLERAKGLLTEQPEPPDVSKPPPDSYWFPTLETLEKFNKDGQQFDCLSIDIENAGPFITLIGLTWMNLETESVGTSLSLPFRSRGGERYWQTRGAHDKAVSWFYQWLADPEIAKVFHNGVSHDVPILEENGFTVRGELWDTMVLSHYTYPEMKKGLQYLSTLYLGTPVWKDQLKEDDEDEGKN